jgi:hypothetical protein
MPYFLNFYHKSDFQIIGHHLIALAADFQSFFLYLGNKTTFCFPYKKIPHNRFPYISLYQLNIIFLLLFYSFFLFPTFFLFLISINYTSFILK